MVYKIELVFKLMSMKMDGGFSIIRSINGELIQVVFKP